MASNVKTTEKKIYLVISIRRNWCRAPLNTENSLGPVYIQDHESVSNFENDTMKLSVNGEKLTDLWARKFATI